MINKKILNDNFKISIVMPVYNCEKYLERMFSTILSQTFDDFEILIFDDGSTDNSLKIIKKYYFKIKNCFFFRYHTRGLVI